ncbi:MAG: ISAs1 family transposase [Candidatus Babeliales bacterium]
MDSPIDFFDSLPDPRIDRTRLHELKDIIFITIAAVLSGCEDWNDIELYGKAKEDWLKTFLQLPNGIPSHDTFNRVFAAIDPGALEKCFVEWVQQVAKISEGQIVSIDGKRLCNSGCDGKKSIIHMVSAWSNANNMVLGQLKVDDKSNEITAIPALLEVLELKGCIITIDAMGCQRAIAETIINKDADYILALKGNQGHMLDDVEEAFKETVVEPEYTDMQQEVDHGRIEKRCCRVIDDLEWICKKEEWKDLKSIISIETERYHKHNGKTEREVRYYISSLAADATKLNAAIREHWGIENHLHWSLDVVFGEDQSQKRAGNAAQNFSIITRVALNIIKNDKKSRISMKNKRHKAGWDNNYLLKLISMKI